MTIRYALLVTTLLTTAYVLAEEVDTDYAINKIALERLHTDVWSKGNVELIASVYTEDYVGHYPGGEQIKGHEGIRRFVEAHRVSFPRLSAMRFRGPVSSHFPSRVVHSME